MSKLFENELQIANDEDLFISDDDEAGKTLQTWNSRKRSMLPKEYEEDDEEDDEEK